MDLHEYQIKYLLNQYHIPIPLSEVVRSEDEAISAITNLGGNNWVLKAQIHASGRSQAGGIRVVATEEELCNTIKQMISSRLITPFNAPEGQVVNQVLIEKPINIVHELYISLMIDNNKACMKLTVYEENKPAEIFIHPLTGLQDYQCREIFYQLNLEPHHLLVFTRLLKNLYRLFIEKDLTSLEINPLALTSSGAFVCIDAKSSVDDAALFRQAELRNMRDITQEQPREIRAEQCGLHFVQLKGEIGCMVNGTGLTLAIIDLLANESKKSACFLDLRANINKQSVVEAFKIMLSDRQIKGILINIFTGSIDCNTIAEGIVAAIAELNFNLPIVVNLQGFNADSALTILKQNNLGIRIAKNVTQAIQNIVTAMDGENK